METNKKLSYYSFNCLTMRLLLSLIISSGLIVTDVFAASELSISQSVSRKQIAFEDSLQFEIKLEWLGPQSAYLFTKPLQPNFTGLQTLGFTSSISSKGAGVDERTTKSFKFTLQPTESGSATIEPVQLSYVTWPDSIPGELSTEMLSVEIAPRVPPEPEADYSLLWFTIGGVVFVALVFAVMLYLRRKNRPVEPVRTAAQIMLDNLPDMKQRAQGNLQQYQSELYQYLSNYLMVQHQIDPNRLNDEELSQVIEQVNLPNDSGVQISQWLIAARRDKFRPVSGTPGEITRLETAIRLVFEKF